MAAEEACCAERWRRHGRRVKSSTWRKAVALLGGEGRSEEGGKNGAMVGIVAAPSWLIISLPSGRRLMSRWLVAYISVSNNNLI